MAEEKIENNNNEEKKDNKENKGNGGNHFIKIISWFFIFVSIILVIVFLFYSPKSCNDERGWDETYGGFVMAIISLANALLLFLALRQQSIDSMKNQELMTNQMQQQEKHLNKQLDVMQQERYISLFINLKDFYYKELTNIKITEGTNEHKGFQAYNYLVDKFDEEYNASSDRVQAIMNLHKKYYIAIDLATDCMLNLILYAERIIEDKDIFKNAITSFNKDVNFIAHANYTWNRAGKFNYDIVNINEIDKRYK